MSRIVLISGPCGCGKSTFANAYAKHLLRLDKKQVYVIHGDDFHRGFVMPEDEEAFFADGDSLELARWEDILQFNWDCIIATAERALKENVDVLIDYVVEEELPRVRELADLYQAPLYYIVLTAEANEIENRICKRGDTDLIERSLFLKKKLETMPENQGHIIDNTRKSPENLVKDIILEQYLVK